jgi:hypothetical protein
MMSIEFGEPFPNDLIAGRWGWHVLSTEWLGRQKTLGLFGLCENSVKT